jgi:hypothetical protein
MSTRSRVKKTRASTRKAEGYIIAIPSYKRAETLRDKTLTVLASYRIPSSKIYVFVANKEQEDLYKSVLKPGSYGHMIVGVPGMAAIRNFITGYFPVGKQIVNMDDDIKGFLEFSPSARRHEIQLKSLDNLIKKGFAESARTGFRLWGIYPVANGFFMKEGATTDLKYVIGAFWGITNPGSILTVTIDDKEDYLRSLIMYVLDGGVLRFRDAAPMTAYYKEAGGMQEERTKNRVTKSAEALHAAFPNLTKLNATKKSGYLELRMRDGREKDEKKFGPDVLKEYKMPHV